MCQCPHLNERYVQQWEPNISFVFVPIPKPYPSATTYAHPCYSNCAHVFKNGNITNNTTNNIAPMPIQNPWAWVGMGMSMGIGTRCRALLAIEFEGGQLRLTSHTRLRAHDHYTSSILIGGKGRASWSSLHPTLALPMEYVSKCKMDVKSTWNPTWHRMDRVSWSLGLFSKPAFER